MFDTAFGMNNTDVQELIWTKDNSQVFKKDSVSYHYIRPL
jgi:hypothetical protein